MLLFFLVLSWMVNPLVAQDLAWAGKVKTNPEIQPKEQVALESLISDFELKYNVRLNFNSKLIAGKEVDKNQMDFKGNDPLRSLHQILKPLNLKLEKVNENHYVIVEKDFKGKKVKSINPKQFIPESSRKHSSENKIQINALVKKTAYLINQADITVSGKVTSGDEGVGIPGVNILIKGTNTGTTSDVNGNYTLTAPEDGTLVFSFVGFESQEIPINNRSVIDVTLAPDVAELSEVVVIGYGQQEVRDATGSVTSVKAENFNQGVISSPEQLIQGRAAGVQITQASGEPGSGVNIRIRGSSSVRGGNNPLFVVDGVPLAGDDISAGGVDIGRGSSSSRNPLNFLNPNDIESIDILKDASATAIYGSRGANGVVLITTKSGKGKAKSLEYNTNVSFAQMANRFDLLDRDQFLSGAAELGVNIDEVDLGSNTDWQDQISRTAVSHRHDLSFSNAFSTGNYRASVSYDNQQGVIKNSVMERISGRLNANKSFFNDRLNLGAQLTLARVNDLAPPITNNAGFEGDLLGATYMANPTWPADPDIQPSNTNANPLSLLEYTLDQTATDRALFNISAEYDIVPDLSFKVNTGFDRTDSEREGAYSPALFLSNGVTDNGRGYVAITETSSNLLEAFFNYNKDMGNSKINALVGYSYQEFNRRGSTITGWGFNGADMQNMVSDLNDASSTIRGAINRDFQQFGYDNDRFFINTLFPTPETIDLQDRPSVPVESVAGSFFEEIDELQSFFGRVNYSIQDKYLFTATLRADGSTRFGGNNKYGLFPSVSAAWRLSDEPFMPAVFDDLKLRLGYGVNGNQEIPHNVHQQRQRYRDISIENGGNINPPGTNNVAFNNPDLKWEQTSQLNLGMDFAFGSGRFNGSIDLYRKVTSDLLIQQFAAQPSPTPFNWINLDADVINSGVELVLNYYAVDNDDVGLSFGLNLAYNDNTVEGLQTVLNTGEISGQGLTGAFAQRIANDQPLYAYFLRRFTGYNQEGLAVYADGDFQQFLDKGPIPHYNVGFNIDARFGNFDISTFLAGQFGFWVYNNTANAFFTKGSLGNGRNVTEDVLGSPESPVNAPDVSTRFLERGDFMRMQNLNLGYNVNLSENSFIQKLRFYASGQNLFVITNYTGLDPEVNVNKSIDGVPSLGIDYTAYPRPITVTIGLNATF
ncbi:MAG: SusC/RagA family TonB-linked outer membrane protein [Candidatus Cyclobacteriaceae bacterium M3_2C_046]